MAKTGPIVIIDDDPDDQEIIQESFCELNVQNPLKVFTNCDDALYFLMDTEQKPLIILCDINLPKVNGLQFRHKIMDSDFLKKKSIPFIFFTTTSKPQTVEEAYVMTVQGFFQKPSTLSDLKHTLKTIIDYWSLSLHPES